MLSFQYCSILLGGDSKIRSAEPAFRAAPTRQSPRFPIQNACRYHIRFATCRDVYLTKNTEIELLVFTFDTHMGLYQQRRRLPSHIPQLREEIVGVFAGRTGLLSRTGRLRKPTNHPKKKSIVARVY